jgi:hypothetical protein
MLGLLYIEAWQRGLLSARDRPARCSWQAGGVLRHQAGPSCLEGVGQQVQGTAPAGGVDGASACGRRKRL